MATYMDVSDENSQGMAPTKLQHPEAASSAPLDLWDGGLVLMVDVFVEDEAVRRRALCCTCGAVVGRPPLLRVVDMFQGRALHTLPLPHGGSLMTCGARFLSSTKLMWVTKGSRVEVFDLEKGRVEVRGGWRWELEHFDFSSPFSTLPRP